MTLHKPITFEQDSFRERTLGEDPDPAVRHAVVPLHERRAFFFTGAGSSAGAPTKLPTGSQLAAMLVDWARESGAGGSVEAVENAADLGQICAALEASLDRPTLARHIRKVVDWKKSEINLCHLTLALLYAEGILRVSFTSNWDPKVEDALDQVDCETQPRIARDEATMGEVGTDPYLVHLHGHYDHPESLVMTDQDLAEPTAIKWTDPALRTALAAQDPIFVGFSAEPEYVVSSLTEMRAAMKRPPAAVIALDSFADFRAKSVALSGALKLDQDEDRYVSGDALEVMGELLRCCYRKLVDEVLDDAETRAQAGRGSGTVLSTSGINRVRETLGSLTLERYLGLLWGTNAKVTETGTAPQATMERLRDALSETLAVVMVLASCTDVANLSVTPGGFRFVRDDASTVDVWTAIPREHLCPTDAVARILRHGSRFSGPADSGVPLVVICAGTSGALPSAGKVSLTGSGAARNVRRAQRVPVSAIDFNFVDSRFEGATGDMNLSRGLNL